MNSFSLSTPELLALLHGLDIRTIMGLPSDPYEGMDRPAFVETITEGMRRFGKERGYGDPVEPENPRAQEISEIEFVLYVCGTCDISLLASQRKVGEENGTWRVWHRRSYIPEFSVEYQKGDNDIHLFTPIEKKNQFYERLWALFPKVGDTNLSRPITLSAEDDAAEHLSAHRKLKDAVLENGTWLKFSALRYNGFPSNEITILADGDNAWFFNNTKGQLSFIPINSKMLKMAFVNLSSQFFA